MKKSIVSIILIAILAVALWYGFTMRQSAQNTLPPFNKVVADKGPVSQRIVAHGTLQPIQMVTVGSQVSGIVDEIHVDFNSMVRRGQILARIDPSTFEAAVSSARAELASAESALELAKVQYDRAIELRENQFIAPSEVDQASANMSQARSQVQVRLHALERAQRELDRCTIYAPTDGIVISRDVDVGQTVAASLSAPILFEIATDLSKMYIHANVSEADIGGVKEGQFVRFRVDAYRDVEFTGEVVQVRNAPLVMENVVHYESIIAVDNSEGLLKPGMTAEVNIITAESKDAIRVRNTALRARLPDQLQPPRPELVSPFNGVVYVLQNGRLEAKMVQAGLSDGVHTEILDGLTVGDTLIVGLSLRSENQTQSRSLFSGNQAQF